MASGNTAGIFQLGEAPLDEVVQFAGSAGYGDVTTPRRHRSARVGLRGPERRTVRSSWRPDTNGHPLAAIRGMMLSACLAPQDRQLIRSQASLSAASGSGSVDLGSIRRLHQSRRHFHSPVCRQGGVRYAQISRGLLGIDAKGSFWELRQIFAVGAGRVQTVRLDIGRRVKLLTDQRSGDPRDNFAEILVSRHAHCHRHACGQQEPGFPYGAFRTICRAISASQSSG